MSFVLFLIIGVVLDAPLLYFALCGLHGAARLLIDWSKR